MGIYPSTESTPAVVPYLWPFIHPLWSSVSFAALLASIARLPIIESADRKGATVYTLVKATLYATRTLGRSSTGTRERICVALILARLE